MLAQNKRPEEDWVSYVQRVTHTAEDRAHASGHRSWDVTQKARKWKFAGEVARSTESKWSTRLLQWRPFFRCTPGRRVARPFTRWTDELVKFAGGDWRATAQDASMWAILADGFSNGI